MKAPYLCSPGRQRKHWMTKMTGPYNRHCEVDRNEKMIVYDELYGTVRHQQRTTSCYHCDIRFEASRKIHGPKKRRCRNGIETLTSRLHQLRHLFDAVSTTETFCIYSFSLTAVFCFESKTCILHGVLSSRVL